MSKNRALRSIDESLIRMRRLLDTPPEGAEGVDLSAVLIADTIARRNAAKQTTCIADVADQLQVKPSTASRLVGSAEKNGYLKKTPNPADPRSVILTLTDAGRDLNVSAGRYRLSLVEQATAEWSHHDLDTFAALLHAFSLRVSKSVP